MKIFWLKGRAGLGNRLYALVAAATYCRQSGRRLYVDWSDTVGYSRDRENVFGRCFFLEGIPLAEPLGPEATSSLSVFPATWQGRLHLSCHEIRQLGPLETVHFGDFARSEDVVVGWAFDPEYPVLKTMYGCPRNEAVRRFLLKHLRIEPGQKAIWDAFAERHGLGAATAMHVRYSDNLDPRVTRKDRPAPTPEQFLEIARTLDTPLFLCTDNSAVRLMFEREFGERVVTYPKWYPEPGQPMHYNPAAGNTTDDKSNFLEACADMYLMSRCPRLVRGDSSMSLISHLMAPVQEMIVVEDLRSKTT